MDLKQILETAVEKSASDVHFKVGLVPVMRVGGTLVPVHPKAPLIKTEDIDSFVEQILDPQALERYKNKEEIDMSLDMQDKGRFRFNIFRQMGAGRVVARHISSSVPRLSTLHLPPIVKKLAKSERGLILVTGVTGSGKSTTLASLINRINMSQNKHIVTIEDPIEYLLKDHSSIVTQREVGSDTVSFNKAIRSALRQDPDVIFIGEMRDLETMEVAIKAAASGHLVLSTLHTTDAKETINRIIGYFPSDRQNQIRAQLASALTAIVSQRLVRAKDGEKVLPAVEVLINTKRVQQCIEDPSRTKDLTTVIEEGASVYGMQTFDQGLMEMLKKDQIALDEAMKYATSPEDFAIKWSGVDSIAKHSEEDHEKEFTSQKEENFWKNIEDLEIETGASHSEKSSVLNFYEKQKRKKTN